MSFDSFPHDGKNRGRVTEWPVLGGPAAACYWAASPSSREAVSVEKAFEFAPAHPTFAFFGRVVSRFRQAGTTRERRANSDNANACVI